MSAGKKKLFEIAAFITRGCLVWNPYHTVIGLLIGAIFLCHTLTVVKISEVPMGSTRLGIPELLALKLVRLNLLWL